MNIKINITNILLYILLFPPMLFFFFNNNGLSKQLSTLILLGTIFILFIYLFKKLNIKLIDFLLLEYIFYMLLDILIKQSLVIGEVINRDFGEILRVIFIGVFFYLGQFLSKQEINYNFLYKILIFIILILSFMFLISHGEFILNKLYNSEQHRFSGIMPGINYIWLPLSLIFLSYFSFCKKGKIYSIILFFILLFALLLSASFTSIIVFFSIVILFFNNSVYSFTKIFIIGGLFIILFIYFVNDINMGYTTSKLLKLYYFFENGFDITQFSSLEKRFEVWNHVFIEILNFPLTGHGSDKSHLLYTDNSYIMTLYRYGFIGLFLEIIIYLNLFLFFYRRIKYNKEYMIPTLLIIGQLIASITTNVFYELKAPYILFFLYGYYYRKGLK